MQQRLPRPANSGAQHATSQSPETNMVWPIFNKAIIQAAQRREGHNNLYRSLKKPSKSTRLCFFRISEFAFLRIVDPDVERIFPAVFFGSERSRYPNLGNQRNINQLDETL